MLFFVDYLIYCANNNIHCILLKNELVFVNKIIFYLINLLYLYIKL